MRADSRGQKELREIKITNNFLEHDGGSVLIEFGKTKAICSAMIDDGVPPFCVTRGKDG